MDTAGQMEEEGENEQDRISPAVGGRHQITLDGMDVIHTNVDLICWERMRQHVHFLDI